MGQLVEKMSTNFPVIEKDNTVGVINNQIFSTRCQIQIKSNSWTTDIHIANFKVFNLKVKKNHMSTVAGIEVLFLLIEIVYIQILSYVFFKTETAE